MICLQPNQTNPTNKMYAMHVQKMSHFWTKYLENNGKSNRGFGRETSVNFSYFWRNKKFIVFSFTLWKSLIFTCAKQPHPVMCAVYCILPQPKTSVCLQKWFSGHQVWKSEARSGRERGTSLSGVAARLIFRDKKKIARNLY